jgi:dolichol-phosphate mannosyltransferase
MASILVADLARAQPGLRQALRRFAKFNAICSMGLVFNVLLLNLMYGGLHLDRYVANAVAVGVVTLWNFWLNLELRWRASSPS